MSLTVGCGPPSRPVLSGDHDPACQRAMRLASMPPIVVKSPQTYRSGPLPSSKTAIERTQAFVHPAIGVHHAPSHRDTKPDAEEKPLAKSVAPSPSSNSMRLEGLEERTSSAVQLDPFHFATPTMSGPAPPSKTPPAYS